MKDYRLSEIKAICKKNKGDCEHCIFQEVMYFCEYKFYDCGIHLWRNTNPKYWVNFENWDIGDDEDDETRDI